MGPKVSNGRRPPHVHMLTGAGRWAAILFSLLAASAPFSAVFSVEPSEEFLKGLNDRGLNELALDYLDTMRDSPLPTEEFRKEIPYQRGVTLIEQSRKAADPDARNRLLDRAREELEKYAEANPDSVTGAEAQMQLGSVFLERGQQEISQSNSLPQEPSYDGQRRERFRNAQRLLVDARTMFQSAEATYSEALNKLPPPNTEPNAKPDSRRQDYRARVAQLLFLAAQSQFEAARSYSPGSSDFKKLNQTASKELSAIYEEYARVLPLPGLYARLYEGRCYMALENYQLALGSFEDIRSQPNVLPPLRKLIAAAYRYRAECLLAQDKADAAIEDCRACLTNAKPDEEKQPEWLAVRYHLAQALSKKSESLPADSTERRKLVAEAREAYRFVANSPGEFQAVARAESASIGRRSKVANKDEKENKEEPRSFQQAYDRGKDALGSYNAAKLALPSAERNNPDAIPDLKDQMSEGVDDARRNFRLAMTLVGDDTDQKLVNEVRYFLCWLYWESEDYYHSAVLGDFLARRYPDHPAASAAAKLSMASFERLYQQAAAAGGNRDSTEFEARHMAQMADFITRRWPDSPDADAAYSVLVSYAIRDGRIEDAQKMLADASESSRPRLELQLGNAMWGKYLELAQADAGKRPDDATLNELKDSAVKLLQSGFAAARKERTVSDAGAAAGLYLVQSLLSDGKYAEAIELLEDDQVGPLTLVTRGDQAVARPQFALEVYKAALRAYASATPPRGDEVVKIMKLLETAVAETGASADQVTRIYVSLGGSLQKQINELREAGHKREADQISAAMSKFLDRIHAQGDTSWTNRVWVAQNFYTMATGGDTEQTGAAEPLKGAERKHLIKARDAFASLIADAAKDPKLPPSESAVLAVKMQLGECHRQLGEYEKALDIYSDILKDKESSLSVQRAAALAYQQRGQSTDAQWLERAVQGGVPMKSTGKNRIWGWLRIAQVAQRAAAADKKYWDTFFEARLNVARCRYLVALKLKDAERQQDLTKAKQSIQSMLQLYPELGGERWKAEFNSLMKDIQKSGDEPQIGLSEFTARKT